MKPETRYARSGDVHIAYQVIGEGPFDVVFVPGYVTHLELAWDLTFAPALTVFGLRAEARKAVQALGQFDDEGTEAFLDYVRLGASPGMLEALLRMNKDIDIRHVLPAVRVPTLILHGSNDELVPIEVARYMADRIRTASLVEIPGAGHLAVGEAATRIVAEIERFLTDVWESGGWQESEPDRVLATVLFTDIVDSTAKAIELKLAGIALHTGARVAAQAQPGEVLVSSTVKDLVAGSGIRFEDRGIRELKGVPGQWRLFRVEGEPA